MNRPVIFLLRKIFLLKIRGNNFESQNVNVAHLDRDLVLGRLNSRLNYSKENI